MSKSSILCKLFVTNINVEKKFSLLKSNIYAKLFCTHTGYRYNLKIYPIQIIQRVVVLLDQLPNLKKYMHTYTNPLFLKEQIDN